VAIATQVIRDGLKSALGAGIEMTSERDGAAILNRSEGFELLQIEGPSIPVEEALALHAGDTDQGKIAKTESTAMRRGATVSNNSFILTPASSLVCCTVSCSWN
jgi:hypothetical protein